MAENTKSHETCSTLSTNALDVYIFFQGRRMWPLARESADPVERVGSWKKRGRDSRSSVKRCFQEEKGGDWAGEQMWQLGHLSFSMRSWENLVFFKYPWGWEDQASTRVRLRAARRVLGLPGTDFGCHFRPLKHYFR